MSVLLKFENLNNIRDLGGMKTGDGRSIRRGKLIRSGQLFPASASDTESLSEMVEVIVDFRTDQECDEKPDPIIPGTEYLHYPIFDELTAGITREQESVEQALFRLTSDPENARRYMCRTYEGVAASETSIGRYRDFIRLLLTERDKAVLWHCTAGKDRAGIASVIVERILGVPEEAVRDDYLATNLYLEQDILYLTEMFRMRAGTLSKAQEKALRYLFGASPEYLEAALSKTNEIYGSFEGFIRDGIQVGREEEERLKELYLE